MDRVEWNRRVRSLRHVLAVLVGGADIVETDAVRTPRPIKLSIEIDRIDAPVTHLARDCPGVQVSRQIHLGALPDLALEPRQHLLEGLLDVAAHHAIVARHPMPEIAVLVPVWLVPGSEMPDVAGRDRAQVQGVLTGVEPKADDDVVGGYAPPPLHRLVVAAE